MKRILVYGMNNVVGGIESYLLNLYAQIYGKVEFIFLVENVSSPQEFIYRDRIEKMNGGYEFLPEHHMVSQYTKTLKEVLSSYRGECDTIYVNFNNVVLDIIAIETALSLNYRVITHSHNAVQEPIKDWKLRIRNNILRKFAINRLNRLKIDRFAVSKAAGKYIYANKNFDYLYPGIDIQKYAFNEHIRDELRDKLQLKECLVIGFVGRLVAVKNPLFLIDVLAELERINVHAKLLVVGDGPLKEEVHKKAVEKDVEDGVIFTGAVNNVQDYLQAMDIMIAPSFSEGMPLVVAEAQSSGLPCICAKGNIPEEVNITGAVEFFNLSDGAEEWAREIQRVCTDNINRYMMNKVAAQSPLNIENVAKRFLEVVRIL